MGVKTARERDGLAGPVRTIRHEKAKFSPESGQWVERVRILSQDVSYESGGSKSKEVAQVADFGPGGNMLVELYQDRYEKLDDRGNLIEEGLCKRDGSVVSKWVYAYNAKGNRVHGTFYFPVGLLYGRRLYNSEGDRIKEVVYNRDGSLREYVDYKYDDKRNVTEEVAYLGKAYRCHRYYTYEFDHFGNWTVRRERRVVVTDGIKTQGLGHVRFRELTYY